MALWPKTVAPETKPRLSYDTLNDKLKMLSENGAVSLCYYVARFKGVNSHWYLRFTMTKGTISTEIKSGDHQTPEAAVDDVLDQLRRVRLLA